MHKCLVSWCIGMAAPKEDYCAVHRVREARYPNGNRCQPPPVQKELQRRYEEETAQAAALR